MDLNPDNIKAHIGKIGQKEAITILEELLRSSSDLNLRKKSLELLGNIDDSKHFKLFEEIFLSDESIEIRISSGKILEKNYMTHKKLTPLLEFTLFNIDKFEQKFLAIEILNRINSTETRKIIKKFLKKFIKSKLKVRKDEFPREIFIKDFTNPIPASILEICFNLILYDYYITVCGFNITLRKGYIILLNCEGSGKSSIKEIDALNKLTKLEHLLIRRNNIRKIDGIEFLKNLKVLDLASNNIEKIEVLKLENLEELDLSFNAIKSIENLESLKKLKKLNLEANLINRIENMNNLSNLEDLDLSNNGISEIKNLNSLIQLKKLNLSYNKNSS